MNFATFSAWIASTSVWVKEGVYFVYFLAAAVGIYFIASAAMMVVNKGKNGHKAEEKSWGNILGRVAVGSSILTLNKLMDLFESTNGSVSGAKAVLAYYSTASNSSADFAAIYAALATWCVFIGTIGFFRGFLLFDKASQGGHDSGDSFWRGTWHVVFGSLTVQIFS